MLVAGLRYAGVGIQFVAEAGVVTALGWWGDSKLGTTPWLVSIGAMLGVALATTSLIRSLGALESASKATQKNENRSDSQ
jgi:F0F1-type ATP synthase assembly protein I